MQGGFEAHRVRERDDPEQMGTTVWSPFRGDTNYFDPSPASFMINYRVADLHGLLAQLRIELWEPSEGG